MVEISKEEAVNRFVRNSDNERELADLFFQAKTSSLFPVINVGNSDELMIVAPDLAVKKHYIHYPEGYAGRLTENSYRKVGALEARNLLETIRQELTDQIQVIDLGLKELEEV